MRTDRRILDTRVVDYNNGVDAGKADREKCLTWDDINSMIAVVYGNLAEDQPHYARGYQDGITLG